MGPLAIPAATAAVELGYNIYRGIKADKGLKELSKQRMPQYMDAAAPLQQNLSMARRQFEMGLSPEAIAMSRSINAGQMASQFRAATDLGGGQLGSAIGGIGAMNTNQLGLQLGVQDQAARERGMQQMMGINTQLSGLQQRDIAQNISNRLTKEQNFGLAKQQAIQGGINALSGLGQAAGGDGGSSNLGLGSFGSTDGMLSRYMQSNPLPSIGGNFIAPSSLNPNLPLSMRYRTPMTLPKFNTSLIGK
jgi:hypothetical protein